MFAGSPLSGDFGLCVCRNCGLGFYDTSDVQDDFDRYYQESTYYYTAATTGSGGETREDERRYQEIVSRLQPHLGSRDAVIMDIGCGKGGLLNLFIQKGYRRVYGVDLLPACVRHIREERGLEAQTGSALDLPFSGLKADALVYSHVVEHIFDLRAMLKAAREKLNQGGRIYVAVPDASRYRDYSVWPYQEFYLEHLNHFDTGALLRLFGSAGFFPVEHGTDVIETAPNRSTPCLWAVLALGDEISTPGGSFGLGSSLADYLSWSEAHSIMRNLRRLTSKPEGFHLWGVSQWAMLILGLSPRVSKSVLSLVDRDAYKQTRTLMGLPIRPPESLRGRTDRAGILVTALGGEDGIRSVAGEMGIAGPILTLSEVGAYDQN
jgi:SAM-dependent methyltransferase